MLPRRGIDALNPQAPHITFASTSIAVRIRKRLHHRLVGDADQPAAPLRIAFGHRQHLLVAMVRRYAWFDSSHRLSSRTATGAERSEERRVGKECRSRWSP